MLRSVVTLPGVDRHSGRPVRVARDALRTVLGHTAWHVWTILCDVRDRHGQVHITINGIARRKGYVRTAPEAVRSALKRLKRAGMVRDLGWEGRTVPRRNKMVRAKVYVREVYGWQELKFPRVVTYTDAMQEPEIVVVVPSTTGEWLAGAHKWGGARQGAGRKTKQKGQDMQGDKESSAPGGKQSSTPTDLNTLTNLPTRSKTQSSSKEEDAPPSAAFLSSSNLGAAIGGGVLPETYQPGPSTGMRGVPPYPGIGIVMPARIPPPPLLDPAKPLLDNARLLVRIHNAARKARTGKPSMVLARQDIRRSKYFKPICKSVEALIEHSIAPAAWALFSLDVWRDYTAKRKKDQAPFTWVWGAKRVEERRGWFRQEALSYSGGRLVFGPRHRYLITTWGNMRKALRMGDGTVEQIVAEHFPPDASYERCVEGARQEAEETKRKLQQRVARGDFLWR